MTAQMTLHTAFGNVRVASPVNNGSPVAGPSSQPNQPQQLYGHAATTAVLEVQIHGGTNHLFAPPIVEPGMPPVKLQNKIMSVVMSGADVRALDGVPFSPSQNFQNKRPVKILYIKPRFLRTGEPPANAFHGRYKGVRSSATVRAALSASLADTAQDQHMRIVIDLCAARDPSSPSLLMLHPASNFPSNFPSKVIDKVVGAFLADESFGDALRQLSGTTGSVSGESESGAEDSDS